MRRLSRACCAILLCAAACSDDTVLDDTVLDDTVSSTTLPDTSLAATSRSESPACVPSEVRTAGSSGLLDSGGNQYRYELYVPTTSDGTAMALVLNFHGLGSSGSQQAAFSEYPAKAEQEGFVVVHPDGLVAAASSGRASWELAQFDTDERDDVAMAADLIDQISAVVCIDSRRIYATGMSNGGFFTSYLACEMSDRIAATFSVAGVTHHDGCNPSRAIPMGALHGTGDEVVAYGGGSSTLLGAGAAANELAFFEQSMPDEFAEFASDNGCTGASDERVGDETSLRTFTGCAGGIELVFYSVDGGGHTWPGSLAASMLSGSLGYATSDVNATDVGWAFMSQYSLGE